MENAKYYVIFLSENSLAFSSAEIVDFIQSENETVEYEFDGLSEEKEYYFGVKPLSFSNTLGEGSSVKASGRFASVGFGVFVGVLLALF